MRFMALLFLLQVMAPGTGYTNRECNTRIELPPIINKDYHVKRRIIEIYSCDKIGGTKHDIPKECINGATVFCDFRVRPFIIEWLHDSAR